MKCPEPMSHQIIPIFQNKHWTKHCFLTTKRQLHNQMNTVMVTNQIQYFSNFQRISQTLCIVQQADRLRQQWLGWQQCVSYKHKHTVSKGNITFQSDFQNQSVTKWLAPLPSANQMILLSLKSLLITKGQKGNRGAQKMNIFTTLVEL